MTIQPHKFLIEDMMKYEVSVCRALIKCEIYRVLVPNWSKYSQVGKESAISASALFFCCLCNSLRSLFSSLIISSKRLEKKMTKRHFIPHVPRENTKLQREVSEELRCGYIG